jgi:hypothetical protein
MRLKLCDETGARVAGDHYDAFVNACPPYDELVPYLPLFLLPTGSLVSVYGFWSDDVCSEGTGCLSLILIIRQ